MAQTATTFVEPLRALLVQDCTFVSIGQQARIPIRLTPEARARLDWEDAVAWLRQRDALRAEWNWPE